MLYICIPTYNEAPTVGLLLWRIRKVFQEFSREYEVIIYDDASDDGTGETLTPYAEVLPLTVLRGEKRRGYGYAVSALCKEVAKRTRYARRDSMVIMQADFTDQPEALPEFIKKFEGGADIVLAERESTENTPVEVRRLRRVAPFLASGVLKSKLIRDLKDPCGGFALYRITLLREYFKANNDTPLVTTDGWAANVELLAKLQKHARRVEKIQVKPRYDLRPRPSRIRPFADALSLYRNTRPSKIMRTGNVTL